MLLRPKRLGGSNSVVENISLKIGPSQSGCSKVIQIFRALPIAIERKAVSVWLVKRRQAGLPGKSSMMLEGPESRGRMNTSILFLGSQLKLDMS
ncbi:MAG: hypothetical protein CL912_15445 [Deltaproteobacteria bacterium]|nr:hypothetical protein [Deltaproteobacteria bacterium]